MARCVTAPGVRGAGAGLLRRCLRQGKETPGPGISHRERGVWDGLWSGPGWALSHMQLYLVLTETLRAGVSPGDLRSLLRADGWGGCP